MLNSAAMRTLAAAMAILLVAGNVSADAWDSANDPERFGASLSYSVADLPLEGQAASSPWPGVSAKPSEDWEQKGNSAADKIAQAFGLPLFESKVAARTLRDPSMGWAAASLFEPQPVQSVAVNGVDFLPADIASLAALTYQGRFKMQRIGLRCNKDDADFDAYGRPTNDDPECKDTNPGTYHLLLTNYLGLRGQSFVEDRTFDDEVWNQPVSGYEVTNAVQDNFGVRRLKEIDLARAQLLAENDPLSATAARYYEVEVDVDFVGEAAAGYDVPVSSDYIQTEHYSYVLEVDGYGKIVGGAWAGDSKEKHPDFIWSPTSAPRSKIYGMRYATIKDLLEKARSPVDFSKPIAIQTLFSSVTLSPGASKTETTKTISVPGNAVLELTMKGIGEADLYVKLGKAPSSSSYDRRSEAPGANDRVTITAPSGGGVYYVRVSPTTTSTVTVVAKIAR